MKFNIINGASVALMCAAMLVSCSSEIENEAVGHENFTVTAKAYVGDAATTRVSYTENGTTENSYAAGVTAAWESGDVLQAFETNGSTVTLCSFATTAAGASALFTSTGAVVPSSSTTWKACYGGSKSAGANAITCSYDGQVGTLTNLKNYDYMIAQDNGTYPVFDFSTGTRLSYFIRLKLPAGIKTIEFNSSGSWSVTSTANTAPVAAANIVSTVTLASATTVAGQMAYIAVPAIDYSRTGLIVTIFSEAKDKSQGKVLNKDLSALGGKITTLDMSDLTLMDRPTSSIDLGSAMLNSVSTSLGKWAPFNVGAKASPTTEAEANGNYYTWGRTELSYSAGVLDYSWDTYMCTEANCGSVTADPIYAWTGTAYSKTTTVDISGSKFDVARVKWGIDWRMPTSVELGNMVSGTTVAYYIKENNTTPAHTGTPYDNVSGGVYCCSYTNNGNTLFLPAAGEYTYSVGNGTQLDSVGPTGCYFSSMNSTSEAKYASALFFFKGGNLSSGFSFPRNQGSNIRPVMNQIQ